MYKYAVRYLKNTFYPLIVPDTITIEDGQMVLVRTEKGEEALKAFVVNSQIAEIWEKCGSENCKCCNKPEPLTVIRVLSQRDMQTLEEIKKEEVTSFFKCQELVKQHKLNMNLVQCRITFDRRKITFYYTAPERVDFRALLKDLTQVFTRVRIDLRHIGFAMKPQSWTVLAFAENRSVVPAFCVNLELSTLNTQKIKACQLLRARFQELAVGCCVA